MDLMELVNRLAKETNSLYTGKGAGPGHLYCFLDVNDWFGMTDIPDISLFLHQKPEIMVPDSCLRELSDRLTLWLKAYKKSDREKYDLLKEYGAGIFPYTAKIYDAYVKRNYLQDKTEAWKLLDFFLAELPCEIKQLSAVQEENLASLGSKELPIEQAQLLSAFWLDEKKKGHKNSINYKVVRNSDNHRERTAYPLAVYSRMAYLIFNRESWESNRLLQKACENGAYANLWAYISLFFICGLRSGDILKLPKPDLDISGEELRKKVLAGNLDDPARYCRDIRLRMEVKPRNPSKTERFADSPDIKLFIPVSLEEPFGIITAIAASFCDEIPPGRPFLKQDQRYSAIEEFFGAEFAECLGHKNFQTLRANKSYLQGLEMVADTYNTDAPKGYMIAALARSHKGGIGRLPDITEAYLRDAKFSGLDAEFVIREMYERGIFGFIPHLLLESIFGNEYHKLPVSAQTRLINEVGLSPLMIENIVRLRDYALSKAKDCVRNAIKVSDSPSQIVRRLVTGNASAKSDETLCLMVAAGGSCYYPARTGCLGCRYEIHTKAQIHYLMKEYRRLAACKGEWRSRELIRQAIVPVLVEYTGQLGVFPDSDMESVKTIMEAGFNGYDHSIQHIAGREY